MPLIIKANMLWVLCNHKTSDKANSHLWKENQATELKTCRENKQAGGESGDHKLNLAAREVRKKTKLN